MEWTDTQLTYTQVDCEMRECFDTVVEFDERVADIKLSSESAPLHLGRLFLVVRVIRLLGRLRSAALRHEDNVDTGTSRVDGDVVLNTAAVCVDLVCRVVRPVEHLDVVKRTAIDNTQIQMLILTVEWTTTVRLCFPSPVLFYAQITPN